jgi:hypothetical protein
VSLIRGMLDVAGSKVAVLIFPPRKNNLVLRDACPAFGTSRAIHPDELRVGRPLSRMKFASDEFRAKNKNPPRLRRVGQRTLAYP